MNSASSVDVFLILFVLLLLIFFLRGWIENFLLEATESTLIRVFYDGVCNQFLMSNIGENENSRIKYEFSQQIFACE